jgi:hypothetical protein
MRTNASRLFPYSEQHIKNFLIMKETRLIKRRSQNIKNIWSYNLHWSRANFQILIREAAVKLKKRMNMDYKKQLQELAHAMQLKG